VTSKEGYTVFLISTPFEDTSPRHAAAPRLVARPAAAPPLTPDAPPLRGVRLDRVVFHSLYSPQDGERGGGGTGAAPGGSQKRPFIPPIPECRLCRLASPHLITNVRITAVVAGQPQVSSHWQVHLYKGEKQQAWTYFGFYEHMLRAERDKLRIAKKKIILLDDVVESVLDIYHV